MAFEVFSYGVAYVFAVASLVFALSNDRELETKIGMSLILLIGMGVFLYLNKDIHGGLEALRQQEVFTSKILLGFAITSIVYGIYGD